MLRTNCKGNTRSKKQTGDRARVKRAEDMVKMQVKVSKAGI